MRRIINTLIFLALMIMTSCSSTIRTTAVKSYPPNHSAEPIIIYNSNDQLPAQTEKIGTIKIDDSGFSVGCGWEKVLEKAKKECRKKGGTAIQIVSVYEPDYSSTCYRLSAIILKGPEKKYISEHEERTGYNEAKLKTEWSQSGVDEIEGIYEKIVTNKGAKYKIAIKKVSNTDYNVIYLSGELSQFDNLWNEGDLKAKIVKTATPNFYKVEWFMADKSKNNNLYISFDKGLLKTIWSENGMEEVYLKLYPTSESVLETINPEITSSGTGFAISQSGYVVTNYHVIENANSIYVKGVNNNFNNAFSAKVIFTDKNNDLAVILISDEKFNGIKKVPYGFNFTLSDVGENVFALGYPLRATMGDEIKLTNGIISSKTGFKGDISTYQISVPVQPGNSGGPLLDSEGNVIAVISAKHIGAENVSYAIKISYLNNLLELSENPINLNTVNDLLGYALNTY
ncbi:MAG: trypsin-like peptidase domain-containing protein [Bacteroidales bacterium]|jgi:S1-C subfamily serine protease|nr:trypsin-like peptidase domain-containing protein [Bacteroidales bacterium]